MLNAIFFSSDIFLSPNDAPLDKYDVKYISHCKSNGVSDRGFPEENTKAQNTHWNSYVVGILVEQAHNVVVVGVGLLPFSSLPKAHISPTVST